MQAAELRFPDDEARLTGRRQAALTFALEHADHVVRLGCLTRVEDNLLGPYRAVSLEQLAAFQRLAGVELGCLPMSIDDIGLLPRGLRRLTLWLPNW